jgi:hypothetical protein
MVLAYKKGVLFDMCYNPKQKRAANFATPLFLM